MSHTQLLPWAPLETVALKWIRDRNRHISPLLGVERTDVALAEALDVDRAAILRWRNGQRLSIPVADRLAVSLGMHPGSIWDEWWDLPDLAEPKWREDEAKRRDRRHRQAAERAADRAEFEAVWATIDPSLMRRLRERALELSWRLRPEARDLPKLREAS